MESRRAVSAQIRNAASIRLRLTAICRAFATSRRQSAGTTAQFFGDLGKDGIRSRRALILEEPAQRQRGVENQAHCRPSLMRSLMLRPPSAAPSAMLKDHGAGATRCSRLKAL